MTKVKEIQMRQKNWLKQRDQHLKNNPDPSVPKDSHPNGQQHPKAAGASSASGQAAKGADILTIHHPSPQPQKLASKVSDKLNVNVKHGFGSWLQSRSHNGKHQHDDQPNTPPHDGKDHSDTSQQGFSVSEQDEGFLSASSGGASGLNSSRSHLLSPAEFDSLADSIAARVKKDLGIKNNGIPSADTQNNEGSGVNGSLARGGTYVQQDSGVTPGSQSYMAVGDGGHDVRESVDVSSHRCPFCSSLMTSNTHVPMLQVPCGHTVCKRCSSSHTSCRLCGTRVASHTANLMLQQIIQEFHRKSQHGPPVSRQFSSQAGDRPPIESKTSAKLCDVNYSSQLRNLLDRQSALQEEVDSCRRERDSTSSKVKRAEKQVSAIAREEESLAEQIAQLQDKLRSLQEHKEEYSEEYHRLQQEHKAASGQLAMVEKTLGSLGEEIDKVQFLAEGQGDVHVQRRIQHR